MANQGKDEASSLATFLAAPPDHEWLLSQQQWSLQQVVDVLHVQYEQFMGGLQDEERSRYLALQRQVLNAQQRLEQGAADFHKAFEAAGLEQLRAVLREIAGRDIDPQTTYLHTRYLKPAPGEQGEGPLRATRALDPHAQAEDVFSVSLWEAACGNFGFDTAWYLPKMGSTENASYIDGGLSVAAFIDKVRKLDLGARLNEQLQQTLEQGELKRLLQSKVALQFEFDLLEALRTSSTSGIDRSRYEALKRADRAPTQWSSCALLTMRVPYGAGEPLTVPEPGFAGVQQPPERGHPIRVPLVMFRVAGVRGVFTYFPNRPNGALQHEDEVKWAWNSFKHQFIAAYHGHFPWLHEPLSFHDQALLRSFSRAPVRPTGLNWVASRLYDVFSRALYQRDINQLTYTQEPTTSPHAALWAFETGRFASNIKAMAIQTSDRDWESAVKIIKVIVNESLDWLLIPVPGPVRGINGLRQLALFTTLGYSLYQGVQALSHGEAADLTQAFIDLADLMFSVSLERRLGNMAYRRHARLFQRLSGHHKVTLSDGTVGLWREDIQPFALSPDQLPQIREPNDLGFIEHGEQRYVQVAQGEQTLLAQVVPVGDQGWQLKPRAGGSPFSPPVRYDAMSRTWRLALDDSARLSDTTLLERMLGLSGVPVNALEALLKGCAISRAQLDSLWRGEARPLSAAVIDGIVRLRADQHIRQLGALLDTLEPIPVHAADALLALLPHVPGWPADTALVRKDSDGDVVCSYSRNGAPLASRQVVLIVQGDHRLDTSGRRVPDTDLLDWVLHAVPALHPAPDLAAADARVQRRSTVASELLELLSERGLELFEALTRFGTSLRAGAAAARPGVRQLLPDSRGAQGSTTPTVVRTLEALHPQVSRPRLLEVLREHPLPSHEQEQIVRSQLLPERLYWALRRARDDGRRDAALDGIFHRRAFNPDALAWAEGFARFVLSHSLGRDLVVGAPAQSNPYASKGAGDQTIVLLTDDEGRVAVFDHQQSRREEAIGGPDSFYLALLAHLGAAQRLTLDLASDDPVQSLRLRVAQAMLRHRTTQGAFRLPTTGLEHYEVTNVDLNRLQPDATGLYTVAAERYLPLGGRTYQVAAHGQPLAWEIVHPLKVGAVGLPLVHNGHGAWRLADENPRTWEGHEPFRRLGHSVAMFGADAIDGIAAVSGVGEDVLRRVHANSEPPPALLLDSVARFERHQQIDIGLERGREFFVSLLGTLDADGVSGLVGPSGPGLEPPVEALLTRREQARPQLAAQLFLALSLRDHLSADPRAQLIQRAFPSLTQVLADDLVRGANTVEREQLAAGKIPHALGEEARWQVQTVRLNRAFEGLFLQAAQSADSHRLILHALSRLPGWPVDMRVEVFDPQGRVDSLGSETATVRLEVRNTAQGYQAQTFTANGSSTGPADVWFFTALLAGLPAAQRQALVPQPALADAQWREQIAQQVSGDRARAREVLGMRPIKPWFIAPRRVAAGRIGYPLSGRGRSRTVDGQLLAAYRELYPLQTEDEAWLDIGDLGDTTHERREAIAQLTLERGRLEQQLRAWVELAAGGNRAIVAQRLLQCWRKEARQVAGGYELDLSGLALAELPDIAVPLRNVRVLKLDDNALEDVPFSFLRLFPKVRSVSLRSNGLRHFVQNLTRLPDLIGLDLAYNQISFSLPDVQYLMDMVELRVLDLEGNPLEPGLRLQVGTLSRLEGLNLRNTGLTHLPFGMAGLRRIRRIDLRDNRIGELTQFGLALPHAVLRAMDLAGNPLSDQTWDLLRSYHADPDHRDANFGVINRYEPRPANPEHWLADIPGSALADRRALWNRVKSQSTQMSGFFDLIERIGSHPHFNEVSYRPLREDLGRCVWDLLEGADASAQFALNLHGEPYEPGLSINRLVLILGSIALSTQPFRIATGRRPEALWDALVLFRTEARLEVLKNNLRETGLYQQEHLLSSRELAYQIALADLFVMPSRFRQRMDRNTPELSTQDIESMRRVLTLADARTHIEILLSAVPGRRDFWENLLRDRFEGAFATRLRSMHTALEALDEQVSDGTLNEHQYLLQANVLKVSLEEQERALIDELTQREWLAFTGRAPAQPE